MTDLTTSVPAEIADNIEELAERVALDEEEVSRRLLVLGLEDIEQIGDEALKIAE